MSLLRRTRFFVAATLFLMGATVLGYLGVQAYRSAATDLVLRYAQGMLRRESERYSLRIGDGVSLEPRNRLADRLREVVRREPIGLDLEIIPTSGSRDVLNKLSAGELDVAFVHGVLESKSGVYQAAALTTIPLHLLVSDDLNNRNPLREQQGQVIWLDSEGTGTYSIATKVLDFARDGAENKPKLDERSLEQLTQLEKSGQPTGLPRVIFLTSILPSPFANKLIKANGYKLRDLPLAKALSLWNYGLQETEIPEYTYGCPPGAPDKPVRTVGTRLLLVASRAAQDNRNAKQEAVLRLLAAMYESDFARLANLPRLDEAEMDRSPEFPLCAATRRYRDRHQTIFTGENIQSLEALGSLMLGALALLVLPWRALSAALARWRFDSLMKQIRKLGREIRRAGADRTSASHPERYSRLAERLRALRIRSIEDYVEGRLTKPEEFDRLRVALDNLQVELPESVEHRLDSANLNGPRPAIPPRMKDIDTRELR